MSEDPALDFKSATLYAVRLVLHSADPQRLEEALAQRMKDAGGFFENEPVVIDASRLEETVDWPRLLAALKNHNLPAIGVVAESGNLDAARAAGLAPVDLSTTNRAAPASAAQTTAVELTEADAAPVAAQSPAALELAVEAAATPAAATPAMIVNRPLRSGQRIYARSTDLIVIGMVSQGAEVIADGNVHVYGPLRGKAMAGARGDTSARIFTTHLDPELLAVAGVYRVIEDRLDAQVHGKPALVSLLGETLKIEALGE
ncbi:MAG: septum site-determining protein MinC [Bordetella sp.]|uniref:septum site-determining protein MinC n=1 Tax=Bordetella sp. TaxID=28081 RepID=UPI003F7B36AD